VLSNRFSRPTRFAGARAWALASVGVLVVCAAVRPAWGADAAAIDRLNKQALEAFDGLNFDQAKTLLEKAISDGEASGLQHDPSVARAHLDLGMLLIAGFQKRDEAIEQF
jgi:Tfp pilus assembly protein PilF